MQRGTNNRFRSSLLVLAISLILSGSNTAKAEGNATAGPTAINSAQDLVNWMTFYYMHPQPDLLVPALLFADQNGMVQQGEAPLTAFVSRLFAQNPKRLNLWIEQLDGLTQKSKPMLWSSLWWSGTAESKEALNKLLVKLPPQSQEYVMAQMSKPAEPIELMEIKSPAVLDELWGAYSATGDDKYVARLMTALPWMYDPSGDFNKLSLGGAARWSLASNAQQHPKVMKLCLKAKETKPELQKALEQVLADATKKQEANQQTVTRTAQ